MSNKVAESRDSKERLKNVLAEVNINLMNAMMGIISRNDSGVENEEIDKLNESIDEIRRDIDEKSKIKAELESEKTARNELSSKLAGATESYVNFRRAYNESESMLKKRLQEQEKELENLRLVIQDKDRLVEEVEDCYQNAVKDMEVHEKANKELQDQMQKIIFKQKKVNADYDGKISRLENIIKDFELFKVRLGSARNTDVSSPDNASVNDTANVENVENHIVLGSFFYKKKEEEEMENVNNTNLTESGLINATKDIENEDVKNMITVLYTEISYKNSVIHKMQCDRKIYRQKINNLYFKHLETEQKNNKRSDEFIKAYERLENDNFELNEENERLMHKTLEYEKRIEELDFQKSSFFEIIEDLNRERKNLEITLKGMDSMMSSVDKPVDAEKSDVTEKEQDDYLNVLKFENDTLILQLAEYNIKVQELENVNEEMDELVKTMTEGYRNVKNTLIKVEDENNQLKTEKCGLKNTQVSLCKERDELSLMLRKYKADNQELTGEKEKYFQLYAQHEKKSKELDAKVRSNENAITRLNGEKTNLSNKIEEHIKEKEAIVKEKRILNVSLENAIAESKKVIGEKEEIIKKLAELEVKYVEMTRNKEKLDNDVAKLKGEYEELQASVAEMKKVQPKVTDPNQDESEVRKVLENLKQERDEILNDKINISRLYKELEDKLLALTSQNNDMKTFMENHEGMKANINEIIDKLNFTQTKLDVIYIEKDKLIEIIKNLINHSEEISKDNESIAQLNKEAENRLGVLELENIISNNKITELHELLKELNRIKDRLSNKVTELQEENESVAKDFNKMKDEMESMDGTIGALRNENKDLKIKLITADESASVTDHLMSEIKKVRTHMDVLINVKDGIIKDFETLEFDNEVLLNNAESIEKIESEFTRGFDLLVETKKRSKEKIYNSISKLNNLMKALGDTDTERTSLPDSKDKEEPNESEEKPPVAHTSLVTSQIEEILLNNQKSDQLDSEFEKKKRQLHLGAETLKRIERELRMITQKRGYNIVFEKNKNKADYAEGIQNYLNELTSKDLIDCNPFDLKNPDLAFKQVKFLNEKIAKLKGIINFLYETKFQDNKITKCSSCSKKFKFTSRKHQCKVCAQTFCHKCSNYRVKMPISKRFIRVCRNCVEIKEELAVE